MILHSSLESRAPHVTACCDRARRKHVRVGMPVAEAQTLIRHGQFAVHDPATDREQLRTLAWGCQRFTPRAGMEPAEEPESLFLDVTGSEAHFGGVESLCQQVKEWLNEQGYRVRIAMASTFGAAWALAHFSPDDRPGRNAPPQTVITIKNAEQLKVRLHPLPVQALRIPESTVLLLKECGLETIGQVLTLPRSTLPSRFGPKLLPRLDQALGQMDELLEPDFPPVPVRSERKLEFPLTRPDEVQHLLRDLLQEIIGQLTTRRQETQQITCGWQSEVGDTDQFDIRTVRPAIQVERFWDLLSLKLETLQLASGVIALWLEAVPCPAQALKRTTLFDDEAPGEAEFLRLIERLSSRLGAQSVVYYRRVAEPLPELSCIAEPWLTATTGSSTDPLPLLRTVPHRPLRLLPEPVHLRIVSPSSNGPLLRFRWRGEEHTVSQWHGPEQIATGWWRKEMVRRDYYRVETTTGIRFWLFQEPQSGSWFLQGLFE